MSGFEALGLACCVFQTISFARDTITVCRAVYNGQKTPETALVEKAAAMIDATKDINLSIATPTRAEQRLRDISKSCLEAAENLQAEVDKVHRLQKKGSIWASIQVRAVSVWKKSRIESLDETFRQYGDTLEKLLIQHICDKNKALELKQDDQFQNLRADVQLLVTNISAGFTQMRDLLRVESEVTRDHVTKEMSEAANAINTHTANEFQDARAAAKTEARKERLLNSLKFPGMNERLNEITEPDKAEFARVFLSFEGGRSSTNDASSGEDTSASSKDLQRSVSSLSASFASSNDFNDPDDSDDSDVDSFDSDTSEIDAVWKCFVEWLRSDDPLFWIQGKPGSGKSTLVKYLVLNPTTGNLLERWHPETHILSHFFWILGPSNLHNSDKGLYLSLLFQILEMNERLLLRTLRTLPFVLRKESHSDWSVGELEKVLSAALSAQEHRAPLCVFIDGLDEYKDGGFDDLMDKIQTLTNFPKVKLCLASRPEQRLSARLTAAPHLKLHELTWPDMMNFVTIKMDALKRDIRLSDELFSCLKNDLLHKAQGVFLWLHLALLSLTRGIQNGDTQVELLHRLELLPEKLEDLYSDMWRRLNEDREVYRESAAQYLHIAVQKLDRNSRLNAGRDNPLLHGPIVFRTEQHGHFYHSTARYFTLMEMMCLKTPDLMWTFLDLSTNITRDSLISMLEKTAKDISIRCAGILEIKKSLEFELPPKTDRAVESSTLKATQRVAFIHRTALDFFRPGQGGENLIAAAPLDLSALHLNAFKALVCLCRVVLENKSIFYDFDYVRKLLGHCFGLLSATNGNLPAQERILELFKPLRSLYDAGKMYAPWLYPILPLLPHFLAKLYDFRSLSGHREQLPMLHYIFQSADSLIATRVLRNISFDSIEDSIVLLLLKRGANPTSVGYMCRSYPLAYRDGLGRVSICRTSAVWEVCHKFLLNDLVELNYPSKYRGSDVEVDIEVSDGLKGCEDTFALSFNKRCAQRLAVMTEYHILGSTDKPGLVLLSFQSYAETVRLRQPHIWEHPREGIFVELGFDYKWWDSQDRQQILAALQVPMRLLIDQALSDLPNDGHQLASPSPVLGRRAMLGEASIAFVGVLGQTTVPGALIPESNYHWYKYDNQPSDRIVSSLFESRLRGTADVAEYREWMESVINASDSLEEITAQQAFNLSPDLLGPCSLRGAGYAWSEEDGQIVKLNDHVQ